MIRFAFALSIAIHFTLASMVHMNVVGAEPRVHITTIDWIRIHPKAIVTPRPRRVAFTHSVALTQPRPPSLPHTNSHSGPPQPPALAPPGIPQPPGSGNGPSGPPQTSGPPGTPAPVCDQPNAPAKAIDPITPDFPEDLRATGITGTSEIRVDLDASGSVVGVSIYASSGSMQLDQLALAAARASRYSPERRNCTDISGSYLFKVDFQSI